MALVLNELITNAVKHGTGEQGQSEEISIRLCREDDLAKIEIENAGHLDDNVSLAIQKKSSLGLYLVKLFVCEQLKGTFSLQNKGNVVIAAFSFPLCGLSSA